MPIIRVQVRLPYFTLLPEDVATNTLYYSVPTGVPTTAELDDIEAMVTTFYTNIGAYIGAIVSRATDACELRYYNLADLEPRQPLRIDNFTMSAPSAANNLPSECAIVMSYHAAFTSGTPNARRRGRIYIGPLTTSAGAVGSATSFARPSSAAITQITTQTAALHSITVNGVEWVQYSPTTDLGLPVVGGWVDDEFDTQRRREGRSSARTTFTV